jgi:hypothetical protein
MQNVIHFPVTKRRITPTSIDWDQIERLRQQRYPQIPIGALKIIRCIREIEVGIAERVYWSLEINYESGFYPPEIIESCLIQSDIVWILDLLDRFGGELICGEKICKISRLQSRMPVYWVNVVDPRTFLGMEFNSELLCEHYFEARNYYRIFGKNLPDSHLIMFIIWFLNNEYRRYFGIIDSTTFTILLDRIKEGTSIDRVFMLNHLD